MADIGGLLLEIANARLKIAEINIDIMQMDFQKGKVDKLHTSAVEQKENASTYDITMNDTWKRDLADEAVTMQTTLVTNYDTWAAEIQEMRNCIDTAIANAQQKIRDLENHISYCEQRIAEIVAEEQRRLKEAAEAAAETIKNKVG